MKSISLPKVDFASLSSGPAARAAETTKLLDAFSTVGFCLIQNVPTYDESALFEAVRWFYYDVSEQERFDQLATTAFNPDNANQYRGYFPIKPGQLSHKQGFDIAQDIEDRPAEFVGNPLMEKTPRLVLPGREAEVEAFYRVVLHHRDLTHLVANTVMSLIAEAGGEKSDYFEPWFGKHQMTTYRPIRYPKRVDDIPKAAYLDDGRVIATGAHQDSGFLTLLNTFGYPGLEIETGGEWFQVPVQEKGTLVVNLGEQMTDVSNGRFKATVHRVIDIGKDRMSLPFFYEPHYDADINFKIPSSLLWTKRVPEDEPVQGKFPYATFLLNKLPIYAEYAAVNERLPQWMRERYLESDVAKGLECWATKKGIKVDGANYNKQKMKSSATA